MGIIVFIFAIILASINGSESCTNRFEGKAVRVAGDWSPLPTWNALEPLGLMKYDSTNCEYTLTLAGLRPDNNYRWKIVIDGSWSQNYGFYIYFYFKSKDF